MSVDLITFGCRLNMVESEAMRAHAQAAGGDNVVIINTCAVTAEATRQAFQAIRRVARQRPDARIVVTGCAAQIDPSAFAALPEVAHVIGNHDKTKAGTWQHILGPSADEDDPQNNLVQNIVVTDIMRVKETAPHLVDGVKGLPRAFVEVQNGCDHRCTFCIIPFGRGNSRSVPMGHVVEQMRRLVANGVVEAVITGVDITSYGKDLPGMPSLGKLVKAILKHVPDLPRLRISSIDSIEADDDLIDALAGEPRLMPHLHLSLQAGDDMILKRMKRRHLRHDAIRITQKIRALRPDIVFGADIIAGFPTETEEMFARSLDLVDECGLTHLHVFPFSPRPGTPAALMPQVPRQIVKARAARLRARGEAAYQAHLASHIGQTRQVMMENESLGRTEGFALVRMATAQKTGALINAHITGADTHAMLGEAVPDAGQTAA